MNTLKIISILITTVLSGCAGMNGRFDCNVDSGGKCAPMHHINKMANQGVFQDRGWQMAALQQQKYGHHHIFSEIPKRDERTQQIWIGPYEDAAGNYHEAAYVYAALKPNGWIDESANSINN